MWVQTSGHLIKQSRHDILSVSQVVTNLSWVHGVGEDWPLAIQLPDVGLGMGVVLPCEDGVELLLKGCV